MKNLVLILLFFLFSYSNQSYAQWNIADQLADVGEFPSISVAGPDVVWIAGGPHGQPVVYKSTNGGTTWIKTDTTGLGTFDLTAVHAVDSMTAYVGNGGNVGATGGDATFYKTTDGGMTWTAIASTGGFGGFMNGISFSKTNPLFGVAHSAPPQSFGQPYFLAITNDGGSTWNLTSAPGVPNARGAQNSLVVIDEQFYGFGLSNVPGSIYFTNDGGNTWNVGNLGISGNFVSSFAFSSDKIRGVAASQSSLPTISRTTNGGLSWTPLNTGSSGGSSYGTSKWIHGTDNVYVSDASGSNTFVRRSTDGGQTWNNMSTSGIAGIQHMDFYKDNNTIYGYAVTSSTGFVLKMTDVLTGINEPGKDNLISLKNYPNPFKSNTTISFQILNTTDVEIIVYDVLGNEIKELISGNLNPGNYSMEFDGSGLSAGTYYYQIKTGIYTETKKMTLIK